MIKRLICTMLITLMCLGGCFSAMSKAVGTPVGVDLSGMNTTTLNGDVVTGEIFSQYKFTIINFWAPWCNHCLNELSYLQKLYENYSDKGINVLGLLCEDDSSTIKAAAKVIADKKLTYTTIRYVGDSALTMMLKNSGSYIPVTFVVSAQGIVLEHFVGGMSYNQFASIAEKYLNTLEPTPTPTVSPVPTEAPAPTMHEVIFVDWNGTQLNKQTVEHGKAATAPSNPQRDGYAFLGWDKAFLNIVEDTTITAQYRKVGDLNGDGGINSGDAVLILKKILADDVFQDTELQIADVNKDTNVNTGDAVAILRIVVEG